MLKNLAVISLSFCFAFTAHSQYKSDSTVHQKMLIINQPVLRLNTSVTVVSKDFSTKNLPFFCNNELKLEKFTKVPFRFRLGSVAYCDNMEGKNK